MLYRSTIKIGKKRKVGKLYDLLPDVYANHDHVFDNDNGNYYWYTADDGKKYMTRLNDSWEKVEGQVTPPPPRVEVTLGKIVSLIREGAVKLEAQSGSFYLTKEIKHLGSDEVVFYGRDGSVFVAKITKAKEGANEEGA